MNPQAPPRLSFVTTPTFLVFSYPKCQGETSSENEALRAANEQVEKTSKSFELNMKLAAEARDEIFDESHGLKKQTAELTEKLSSAKSDLENFKIEFEQSVAENAQAMKKIRALEGEKSELEQRVEQ
mgnify:CR=1 FL=1